jgi:predicted phage terminase large subunit-like protein
MASFEARGSEMFKEDWVKFGEESSGEGDYYIAVDLAGFEEVNKKRTKNTKLDETAISVVKIVGDEWLVKDIHHGRWNIKETAEKIIDVSEDVNATTVGIESGALKNAIMPYIEDEMRVRGRWINITDVTHGGKRKQDRIVWALQGRMEHGKIKFRKADWNHEFISQMLDFPSPLSHDDLLDSLAYIDQVSVADYASSIEIDEWEPLDTVSGY